MSMFFTVINPIKDNHRCYEKESEKGYHFKHVSAPYLLEVSVGI